MNIEFKVYTPSTTLEDNGTLASLIGKKGTMEIKPSSLNGTKRVVVIVDRNDGKGSAVITCSAKVSALLRAGKLTMHQLAGFPILSDGEDGTPFISLPQTASAGIVLKGNEIKVEAYTPEPLSAEILEALVG